MTKLSDECSVCSKKAIGLYMDRKGRENVPLCADHGGTIGAKKMEPPPAPVEEVEQRPVVPTADPKTYGRNLFVREHAAALHLRFAEYDSDMKVDANRAVEKAEALCAELVKRERL